MPSVLSAVAWAAGVCMGARGLSVDVPREVALRRRLQFQGTPQNLLNGLNPGSFTSTVAATNDDIDEKYIDNLDGSEIMMVGQPMGGLVNVGTGGDFDNYGGIRFSEGMVEPIRGFAFELTSGGKGRVKVTTLPGVQVRDPTYLKGHHTDYAVGEYGMTDVLAQHDMNCNAETWQYEEPFVDGHGSVMMMIFPKRVRIESNVAGDQFDGLSFQFRCAMSSVVSMIIEEESEGWRNLNKGWYYTNWGPVGDMASLADHPVMCPEGKALWHLKGEVESGHFRWNFRCFTVVKRDWTESPTAMPTLAVTDAPTLFPTPAPTDDPCLGVEALNKKTHKKLCKTFKDASEGQCESAICKWKTKVTKKGNLKTKCKKAKGPAIQCHKASPEHCCKFPGCEVVNGQCTGTFLGY